MSKENAKKFLEDVKANKELQAKINSIINGLNANAANAFIEAVNGLGYEFTAEELDDVKFDDEEMDLEELDNVAGGSCSVGVGEVCGASTAMFECNVSSYNIYMQRTDNVNGNEVGLCDECGSAFLRSKSKMKSLCPECAYILYGKPKCSHIFKDGRCIKCLWDGSRSDYIRSLI